MMNDILDPKFEIRKKVIGAVAKKYGWREVYDDPSTLRLRFKKGKNDLIDVWYSKMTVGTVIDHPTKPRKALFRKYVDLKLLDKIFSKPRTHTGEGYYKK